MMFKKSLLNFKKQLNEAVNFGRNVSFSNVSKVLVCGMGGSALPGDFVKSLFYPLNFEISVCRDYEIPGFVDEDYIVFCISYSGNTKETIRMYESLVKITDKIVVITSGGKIGELARKYNSELILVPAGLQPRIAIGYLTFPVINVMVNSGIVKYNLSTEVNKANLVLNYDFEKQGKKIAGMLKDTVPLIYVSGADNIIGLKWKISFNENTKIPAFYNLFPEWNHNEINSFENNPCKFTAVMINDKYDNEILKKRFIITKDLLKDRGLEVLSIDLQGRNKLSRLLFGISLGDWVSYELALIYRQDAESVPVVEELKKRLEE